jgi:hypothetical protein
MERSFEQGDTPRRPGAGWLVSIARGAMIRRAKHQRGQSLVEVALTMPLLLLLLLLAVEVAHGFHSFNILVAASREGGRLGSRGETIFDDTELATIVQNSTSDLGFFEDGRGRAVIIRVSVNDAGEIDEYDCKVATSVYSISDCGPSDTEFSQGDLQALLSASSPPAATDKFIVVELFYDHPLLLLNSVIENPLPMHTYAIMPESGQ